MVDTNVFFQDSVRLVQRLIELRKENWELDGLSRSRTTASRKRRAGRIEYKRILKLFEETFDADAWSEPMRQ